MKTTTLRPERSRTALKIRTALKAGARELALDDYFHPLTVDRPRGGASFGDTPGLNGGDMVS